MRTPILTLTFSLAIGCTGSTPAPKIAAPGPRTLNMDGGTLFVNADNWLYSFPADGQQRVVVGSNVACVQRNADHVIVNLDLTETEKASGKELGSHTLLNVPTSGPNQVIVAYPGGFTGCSIAVPENLDPDAFIQEVLAHPDVTSGMTDR